MALRLINLASLIVGLVVGGLFHLCDLLDTPDQTDET